MSQSLDNRSIGPVCSTRRRAGGHSAGRGKGAQGVASTSPDSEDRFRQLADGAPVLIWISGPDKRCTYFNKPWLEFTGRTLAQELGDGWAHGVHRNDLARCLKTYFEAFDARKPFRMEYRLRRHDGEYRWILDQGLPQFDKSRAFCGYIGSCIDITDHRTLEARMGKAQDELEARVRRRTRELSRANERLLQQIAARKRTGEALRQSEQRLRLMLEGTTDYAIFMLDPNGRVATWNGAAKAIKGYNATEILGRSFSRFYTRMDIRQGKPRWILETARTAGRAEEEGWRVRKNGERFWANVIITALRGKHGDLRGFLKVTRDITAQRNASEHLRLSERSLADFFDQSPLGHLWVGPKGQILRINRAGLKMIGCKLEECLDRKMAMFCVFPEDLAECLARLARGKSIENHRSQWRCNDGTIRHVLIDANGFWEHGKMIYSRWFARDITRRVELEHEMTVAIEREQRRIGQDLHDDLCQQLTGIEYLCQTLARVLSNLSQREADRAREIARLIRQTNTRMREVARGLTPVGLESRGLGEALRNLAADTEKLFGIACRFQANASEENPDLQFGIQLYRIAQEAVSNAIKHGRAKRIRIALRRNRRSLQLSVMDNGSGISKSLRHHDGIGLHVMRHRAEAIGATLKMQRNRSGGMTVVCAVKLPAMHNGLK